MKSTASMYKSFYSLARAYGHQTKAGFFADLILIHVAMGNAGWSTILTIMIKRKPSILKIVAGRSGGHDIYLYTAEIIKLILCMHGCMADNQLRPI